MKKIALGLFWITSIATIATSALADPTAKDQRYGYEFGDELVQGGGVDPRAAMVTVRSKPRRELLIRPRAQFVTELLKTVESL